MTNYFCNHCGKTFFTCGNFETHQIRIHTLYEAFDCPTCTFSYKQSGFLKSHIERHIYFNPFPCPVCRNIFTSCADFWRHSQDTHKREKLHLQPLKQIFETHIIRITRRFTRWWTHKMPLLTSLLVLSSFLSLVS